MAYYGSNFSDGDLSEYYSTPPYNCNFDIVPFQDSSASYSNYELNDDDPRFIEYYPSNYVSDPYPNQPENYYSSYNFLETKYIEYNPTPYQTGYFSANTQYRISYSTSGVNEPDTLEFNVPEFPEYDPTPYDGGYDISQTYGKPLLPSDEICYPRSTSEGKKKEDTNIHSNGTKQTIAIEEEKDKSIDGNVDKNVQNENLLDSNQGKETEENIISDHNNPWTGCYDYGYEDEYNNKQVTQTPYDQYDSDAMGFCESIFGGDWPCLSKKDQNSYGGQEIGDWERRDNHWNNGASDYIFGSGNWYSGGRNEGGGSYENVIFGYQRHYPKQGQFMQVEYDEHNKHAWL